MSDIDNIVSRLIEARDAYYNSDAPLISDAEFDDLEETLRRQAPDHPYFTSVGIAGSGGAKVRHRVPMLSMGKAKTLDEAEKWLRRLNPAPDWVLAVQPKVDGLSASLYYEAGRLKYVATRGDGEAGQDISHIAPHLKDIPETLGFTADPVEIRGELHLPRDTAFDTGGKPLRNNCVGLINRKDDREDLHHVRFLAYQVVWPESGHMSSGGTAASAAALGAEPRLASESGKIDLLKDSGFYTFDIWRLDAGADGVPDPGDLFPAADAGPYMAGELVRQIGSIYDEYIGHLRDSWNFETDGLIVLVDDNRLHDDIDERWVVDHHHHYALAFKPPSEAASTGLKDVVWQVSRQGNLTPVAVFEPVSMGGATLERASLHNADNVRRLKLAAGDHILVERANDVIPYVRDNPAAAGRPEGFVDPSLWPEHCPSCGSDPVDNGVNIACPNPDCRTRVLQAILYWVRQADIEQVALKTLEALYDAGKLRSIHQLYTLRAADFDGLEGFGEKKISNFIDQVAASKSMTPADLIARLDIPMVQKKSLSRLGIDDMESFLSFDDDTYAIGRNILEWKAEKGNMEFLEQLLEVVELRAPAAASERRGVLCLTGKAPMPRKPLTAALEERGWTVAGAVTKETVRVVCDDPSGTSTKLKKSREAGIDIVTYESFLAEEGIEY